MQLKGIKCIKVNDNLVDVFIGDGWENWARILRKGNTLIHLKGIQLPKLIYRYLELEVFAK